ncbi:MAG TPA: DUF4920 domain-containing protein [Thermoanaerobaculia bacterium]
MRRLTVLFIVLLAASVVLASDVVKRGAAIAPDSKLVPLADVIAKPADYAKAPVVVEGVVAKNCEHRGCWMELAPAEKTAGIHVEFKDEGFFIPLNSKGMKARAQGVAEVKVISKEEADELEHDGAKIARNADGTAQQITFVATGVELRRE